MCQRCAGIVETCSSRYCRVGRPAACRATCIPRVPPPAGQAVIGRLDGPPWHAPCCIMRPRKAVRAVDVRSHALHAVTCHPACHHPVAGSPLRASQGRGERGGGGGGLPVEDPHTPSASCPSCDLRTPAAGPGAQLSASKHPPPSSVQHRASGASTILISLGCLRDFQT